MRAGQRPILARNHPLNIIGNQRQQSLLVAAAYRVENLRSPFYLLLTSWIGQMAFAFEKLPVYEKAMDFSDCVCALTQTFPRGFYFLVDQLNRAALSLAANIAEGNGRFTSRDRINFFGIARGSVQECVPLLELAKRRGLIQQEDHLKFKADLEEVAKCGQA